MSHPNPPDGRDGPQNAVVTALETSMASDLIVGVLALDAAYAEYARAAQYYEGTSPEYFASPKFRRVLARTGMNFRINMAKTAVTAVSDRLEIAAITASTPLATTVLNADVWNANELLLESPGVHLRACEFGDAYITVWPSDDGDIAGGIDNPLGGVDIFYADPRGTRIIYSRENPRRALFAIKRWEEGHGPDKTWRANLYYADRIERYVTGPGLRGRSEADWQAYGEPDEPWPIPNDYGQIPVFHFRTDRPYGTPEHHSGYGAQDAINKMVISQISVTDYQAFPQRYALTDPATADDGDDPDDFGFDDEARNVADTIEGTAAKFRSGPGEFWYLEGVKQVGQFPAADPKGLLEPAAFYVRMLAQATGTPMHFFDPGGDQPSGESRRAAEATLTKKVGVRQQSFASTWSQALSFALRILGVDAQVTVRWADAEQISAKDDVAIISAKVAVGVPVKVALMEAGYTADQVDEWITPETELFVRLLDAGNGPMAEVLAAILGVKLVAPISTPVGHAPDATPGSVLPVDQLALDMPMPA
jgi:hypothetical protein